jgi:hypothetical protein
MIDFDQSTSWQALEARLAATDNPRHRKLLETVIAHTKAEAACDVDGLMRTLVAEPAYHFWGPRGDTGPKGYDGVRSYYEAYAASGAAILQSKKERIVVDDTSVAHEGIISTMLPGKLARARGYDVDEDDAHYLVHMRAAILWSFDDDGLAFGEDSYTTIEPQNFEKVDRADLPQVYVAYLEELGIAV